VAAEPDDGNNDGNADKTDQDTLDKIVHRANLPLRDH
jgi:hypothetical protein